MPSTDFDFATRKPVDGRVTGTDAAGCPMVDNRGGVESRHLLTLGELEVGVRAGETAVWVSVHGPLALDEINTLVSDLQAIQGAAEEWIDQQKVRELLAVVEDCEERLAAEGLAEWMAGTGTTVADYLRGKRDAREIDEDAALGMGPEAFQPAVSDLEEVVDALEQEAAAEPLRPHPSSPDSDEQRDFRAAVAF